MDRDKIEEQYKWDLTQIFESIDEFENAYKEVKEKIKDFSKYESIMGDNATNFYNAINTDFEISRQLRKLYFYASMSYDIDTTNSNNQSLKSRVSNLYAELSKATFFITPTILKKDYKEIEAFYKEEPRLLDYEIIIRDEYKYKEHTLTDAEEKLLSRLNKALGNYANIYNLLSEADLSFDTIKDENGNEVELTVTNYITYLESEDREVRKNAFKSLYKTYKQFSNTFASIISGYVNENITIAGVRKYNSAIEYNLFYDELDTSIYDNLIEVVSNNLNILHKYYSLRQQLLGLDELHLYDISVPIVKNLDKNYSFEEAKNIVLESLQVLGEDYVSILKQGYDNRWCDVYPTKGKASGAYSGGCYDTEPYMFLDFQGKYFDLSTLAHESGHSMHSYYARHNNRYQYADYSFSIAEVASTVNELLLANYLLEHSNDKEEKLFILDKLIELFTGTIYRQTMFAEFEKTIYEDAEKDIPLTSEYLNNKYYELNKKYFGENVVVDEEIKYEWEKIHHFYYGFYVYKYAIGLSVACHIVNNILSGKENAVEDYKNFLKVGGKLNPIDSLKVAGVDLTRKEVMESAIKMFDTIITKFKNMYEETRLDTSSSKHCLKRTKKERG